MILIAAVVPGRKRRDADFTTSTGPTDASCGRYRKYIVAPSTSVRRSSPFAMA